MLFYLSVFFHLTRRHASLTSALQIIPSQYKVNNLTTAEAAIAITNQTCKHARLPPLRIATVTFQDKKNQCNKKCIKRRVSTIEQIGAPRGEERYCRVIRLVFAAWKFTAAGTLQPFCL